MCKDDLKIKRKGKKEGKSGSGIRIRKGIINERRLIMILREIGVFIRET